MPANTVKVDRSSRWGNPFAIGEVSDPAKLGRGTPKKLCGVQVHDREQAIALFRSWIESPSVTAQEWRAEVGLLRGKNLACWCPLDGPCHADTLLELANSR